MANNFPGEQWRSVKFNFEFSNDYRLEVSNYGRLRTFNKISDGKIIKGSMADGYPIVRLKLLSPRDEKTEKVIDKMRRDVAKAEKALSSLIAGDAYKRDINAARQSAGDCKNILRAALAADTKLRTMNKHFLIHRLVADYFLLRPRPGQTVVAHLDYDKTNNRTTNLKWMTPEENYEHQKGSPYVIKDNHRKRYGANDKNSLTKLSVTKVMLMKKLINDGKPMKQLVKLFRVTETHINRIKKG